MRAWQVSELGDPIDVLRLAEVDEVGPPPPGNAVVRIEAVGVSFPDVLMCRGEYQVKPSFPFTPGGESAGTVTAVAADVAGLVEGDRVMMIGGGLTEQVDVPAAGLWKLPGALTTEKAAAIPVNYGTTWYALHDRARLQSGETLLVTGAAGGVGSAAIQLGKAAGARVIAIAGGKEKVDRCAELGADEVIDHRVTPDFVDTVRKLSDGGVDVAYEAVGGEMMHQVRRCMGWDGRLLVIGFVGGIPDLPANHILLKNYSVVGVHWGASLARFPDSLGQQMEAVLRCCRTGAVDPLIYPPYDFEAAPQALQDLADRKTFGKVIVGR